jgi:hypothetical protein
MDNEYDLLTKNNEKYFIQISDYKARLRAMDKDLSNEIFSVKLFRFFLLVSNYFRFVN